MKSIATIALLTMTTLSFASNLTITNWYRLNTSTLDDSSAEVCFSVKPAPLKPTFVQIVIDSNSRFQGHYSTWISTTGNACQVVSTVRGRVEVNIPSLKLKATLTK
jgi:hypothetical protein